jgi:hypothetical protein
MLISIEQIIKANKRNVVTNITNTLINNRSLFILNNY